MRSLLREYFILFLGVINLLLGLCLLWLSIQSETSLAGMADIILGEVDKLAERQMWT